MAIKVLNRRLRAGRQPESQTVAILVLGRSGGLSGGDVHALRLAEAWSKQQGVKVLLIGDPGLADFIRHAPDLVHSTITTPFDAHMSENPLALALGLGWRGCVAVSRCRDAQQVIASSHLIFDVLPAAIARLLFRARVSSFVYHIIGDMDRPRGLRSSLAQLLEAISLRLLRLTHAVTFVDNDEVRHGLASRRHRPDLLFDTTNAYDPGFVLPERRPTEPHRLVFIGRLVPAKGVYDILEIARELKQAGSDWQLDIVGDGPARERLEAEVNREGLVNVHLHGFVSEATKWALLSAGTLFLAPSREEGWGIAVGEALLIGLPVIALDLPAYRHFPVPLEVVASGGPAYIQRVLDFVNNPSRVTQAAQGLVNSASLLPRWADVVAGDLSVLNALNR